MTRRALAVAAATLVLAGRPDGLHSSWTAVAADGVAWWKHVEFLADDALQGRDTGSAGHKRAAEYVAGEFRKAGLEPAGTDGFMQPVAFRTRRIDEAHSSLALVRRGTATPLTLGEDAAFRMSVDPAPSVDAPLVFAGHGLNIPEQGIDDFEGLHLRGAVVVYLAAVPRTLPGALQAHFSAAAQRWQALRAAGAVGTITIANPRTAEAGWTQTAASLRLPAMSLADPSLDEYAGEQVSIAMNPARASLLFEGSGHTFDEVLGLERDGLPLPRFALPARLAATVAVTRGEVESQNVAGVLRGADPDRRNEFVVLSAHLDHVGVGAPVGGDAIYNGAMDNASGIAAILDMAARLRASGERPARSLLFLAVTGEEKGELGSRYFAAHPTVPARALVADVNIDMFLPLFPLKELMVLGLDESDLGGDVRAVAGALHVRVQADAEPQRNRFIRSDQYSFIRAGIPSLAMKVGFELNTPEAAVAQKWTAERYHLPSDDLNQPVDMGAADTYIDIVQRLAVRIANRPGRPAWNDASFFKRFTRPGP